MPRRPRPTFGLRDASAGVSLSRVQAVVGGSLLSVVLLAVAVAAVVVTPRAAQRPALVTGTLVLEDERPPVVLDLATGSPTIRLRDVYEQVDATSYGDVQLVPIEVGTLLVNRRTGTFNLLGRGHLAVKSEGGGVGLGASDDVRSADAVGAGTGGFILQRTDAATRISLVGRETVQAAAEATAQGGGTVRPRGYAELAAPALRSAGFAAPAGDHLWVLADGGREVSVHRIGPAPEGDRDLAVDDLGAVPGPAALSVVGTGDDAQVVLQAGDGLRWLDPEAEELADPVPSEGPPPTSVLPVAGDDDVARFLLRSGGGWQLLSAAPEARAVRRPVAGLAAGARLVPGVAASGRVFTYELVATAAEGEEDSDDREASPEGAADATADEGVGEPRLLAIAGDGTARAVEGMERYPRKARGEVADFARAAVTARDGRVVFNNPGSVLAVMAFADGDGDPVVIDKSAALDVTATGAVGTAAEEAADADPDAGAEEAPTPEDGLGAEEPAPSAVSEAARCEESDQQPRVPVLRQPAMGVRSASLAWTYPLLDTADCHPSSFTVSVRALRGPQPEQGRWEVVGQTAATIEGLRPDTPYEFVVTAYLGTRSTPSLPRTGSTLPTGPDAPSAVQVAADGRGQWVVTWEACSGPACDVPVGEWVVSGSSCGAGFVGTPPTVRVDGGARRATVDAVGSGLLGKDLTFRVHGVGYDGLQGDPATASGCVEAWRPPLAERMSLAASAHPAGEDSVTAQLTLATTGPEIEAFGSRNVSFTYEVDGRRVGPTKERTVTVTGLEPGRSYRQQVTVTHDGRPQASVVVTGPPFSQTLPWPTLGLRASAEPTLDPNRARVVVRVDGKPRVAVDAVGALTCGSYRQDVRAGIPAFGDSFTVDMDLVRTGGACRVDVVLWEQGGQRYGAPSPPLSAGFEAGSQPDLRSARARWLPVLEGRVEVTVDGRGKGDSWTFRILPACGVEHGTGGPPLLPVVLDARPCVDHPDHRESTFQVEVSWRYLGTIQTRVLDISGRQPDPPPTTTTTTTTTTAPTSTDPSTSTTSAPPTSETTANGPAGAPLPIAASGLLALALAHLRARRTPRGAR